MERSTAARGQGIRRGSEFEVHEIGADELLKLPHHPRVMDLVFGDFRRKSEDDLVFLQSHFADFLPATAVVDLGDRWGIRQRRVRGRPFFENPRMTADAHRLFAQALATYRTTRRIPDLLNPGNLFNETGTGRLFLVDTSVLGGTRWWPCGYWVSRFLGRVLSDTIQRWLRVGF